MGERVDRETYTVKQCDIGFQVVGVKLAEMLEAETAELRKFVTDATNAMQIATDEIVALRDKLAAAQERVRELEIAANAWHCVFGTSQLSHARAKLQSEKDGRKRAEAALADANAAIEVWQREAQSAQERADQATVGLQVSYGPPKQDSPGGPVYRTGVSTGADPSRSYGLPDLAGSAGTFLPPSTQLNIDKIQQPSAEPVSRTYSCGCVLCICEDEERCRGCGAKSCGKPDAECGYKQERIRAVLRAEHPSLSAAVALTVEGCAHEASINGASGVVTAAIRALAPTLTAEAEAMQMDAERYRWLRDRNWHDDAICVVTNPKETVRLGTNCPSRALLDAAIDAARGKP